MPTFASPTTVEWTVFGYNETDEEEIDEVEDANTPTDLPCGFGNFFPRVFGISGSQPCKFGSAIGERGRNKDATESMETIEECIVW